MQEKQYSQIKDKLENLRQNLADRIKYFDDQGLDVSLGYSVSELSNYDNHPADIGSEVFERSKDFALRENAMITLTAVNEALEKINNGTYGICDVCGGKIQIERLDAVPYTTLCRDCKEAEEKIPDQNVRPVEEEVIGKPFAGTFTGDPEAVGYDGEDAWREVANYSETNEEWSRGGSYYGYARFDPTQKRDTEDVDDIPYEVGDDGVFYKSFGGLDDEDSPTEKIDVGRDN
ncbi:TraR/DksA C4-type zinc finger protein [Pelotomaculum isophthalicicum JI]|uniref:TraR/DksA C4-type zinc finger protein n=1 Tax=Pelotomaculum isophthalicicum JI TaxID=947010 RepID=A0A9X4JVC5_9FIRM|nr:TraR/DksA C4-type zinc finger protein [Pelotomaculum isophthalicicum]MDF9408066.1 TraR/DksA C4-type zinc finger protein [Pelotomaculum isophthalicicum JI]